MLTTKLITLDDIRAVKTIALNVQQAKELDPYILEAQNFDLAKFLGDAFLIEIANDFNASPSLSTYSDLFNGGEYTYNSEKYYNYGLKNLIVYYAYVRYVANSNVLATPTGFKHKTNPHSEHVSDKTISRLVDNARQQALYIETNVKEYLVRNATIYTIFKNNCNKTNNRTKIRQI